ncbi:hypothetical protein VIBNISO65_1020099 [Vibrio nigripulchritudo SO65]|nr:hypothetical protein VIBNISO65_1020099 [Vibrio nigripulchritudo SO65]
MTIALSFNSWGELFYKFVVNVLLDNPNCPGRDHSVFQSDLTRPPTSIMNNGKRQ